MRQLIEKLEPRLILDAHTHNFCQTQYNGTPEWTIASFSWRNRNNPSFILVTILLIRLKSCMKFIRLWFLIVQLMMFSQLLFLSLE